MVDWGGLFLSLLILGWGIVAFRWPYETARHGERWDAIGSKRRRSAIEPAEWKVKLTRISGAVSTGIGVLLVLLSLGYL